MPTGCKSAPVVVASSPVCSVFVAGSLACGVLGAGSRARVAVAGLDGWFGSPDRVVGLASRIVLLSWAP